jgi:hypothetical protein
MPDDIFGDLEFEVSCPKCGKAVPVKRSDIGKSVICPYCKQKIDLVDSGIIDELKNAERAISDLFK